MSPRGILLTATILSSVISGNGALAFTPAVPAVSRSCGQSSTSLMASSDRRNFLNNFGTLAAGTILVGVSGNANALDFDAFEKGEIAQDTKNCDPKKDPKCIPKLTEDQALCQYGSGGKARGEACMRIRNAGGKLPEVKKEKSLGGAYAM